MLRGYYTAASGLVTQEQRLNAYANNIANSSKVGYKKDNLIAGTFGEHMSVRMNAYQNGGRSEIGGGVYMQTVDSKYIDYTQGGFIQTERSLDMAIQGIGYFVVETEAGQQYLTRDGQFALDDEGYLIMPGFGRVQGVDGDLRPITSDFALDSSGYITTWDEEEGEYIDVGQLFIALPEEDAVMDKIASGLFTCDDFYQAPESADTVLMHKMVERSNVDMSEEMSRIIASQRSFQSCSQIVKMYDEMAEQMNTRISRV